jgi:glyoxylate/hydroxypyruvate reductase A
MSLVIIAPDRDASEWVEGIAALDKNITVEVWPDVKDRHEVIGAVVWNHPAGSLGDYPNLKFISSMGAGVDHVLKDKTLPSVPIVRIVDEDLTRAMTQYIIAAVTYFHRRLDKYTADKWNALWDQEASPEVPLSIGMLGMGVLGTDAAKKLKALGFQVCGYSNSPKQIEGIKSFHGTQGFEPFIKSINMLICLLPLTQQTRNILNIDLFQKMQQGSYLINVARGGHLVEQDLLRALEEGYLAGAFLDVYQEEPLPQDHPFWKHPNIMMTPHIASITNPQAAIPQVVQNYHAAARGEALQNAVDLSKGY